MSRGKDTICSGVCDLRCFGDKTPLDEPLVLSSRVSRQNNAKPHRHYFDCDLLCKSTANQTQICNISSLRAQFIARGNPNLDNMNFLTMGGALSIDKNRRVRDISWWKQEAITKTELDLALKNIESFENSIDFVLSHTLPQRAVDEASKYMRTYHKEHDENPLKLEKIFESLQNKKHNVKAWICGHWHKDISFNMQFLPRKRLKFFVLYNGISVGIDKNKKIKEVELRNGY